MDTITCDHFFGGKIRIFQSKDGYRSSLDACLLVEFVSNSKPVEFCIELGIGNGLIGIALSITGWAKRVAGIEINVLSAELAKKNVSVNRDCAKIDIICGDLKNRTLLEEIGRADSVVMNPPFWELGSNQEPKNEARRMGDHEVFGTLEDWCKSGSKFLKNKKSRFFMIYPAGKLEKCIRALRDASLSVERMRFVHPVEGKRAEFVLIEARKTNNRNIFIESPLFLKFRNGESTKDAERILQGRFNKTIEKLPDRREEDQKAFLK